MILVVGATGLIGGKICYLLAAKGLPFRAMVRQTSDFTRVERLKSYGSVLVQGDLRETVSVQAACRGARVVICTACTIPFSYQNSTNDIQTVDLEGAIRLIEVSVAAGIGHFIYVSCALNGTINDPLWDARKQVEQRLIASGLQYTILRPGFLLDVWLSPAFGFDPLNNRAKIYGSGEQPIWWISTLDVARYVIASLENPFAVGVIRTLTGPEPISPRQVIRFFEQESHQDIDTSCLPVETLQRQFQEARDPVQKTLAGWKLAYAAGNPPVKEFAQPVFLTGMRTVGGYVSHLLKTRSRAASGSKEVLG